MKIHPLIPVLALSVSTAISAFAAPYSADSAHSNVDFTIRHLVSNVRGSFDKFEGSFEFDEAKADAIDNVKFSIDTQTINTGNKKRDDHLRSPDFFDVKKNPKIDFVGKKITKAGDKRFKVEGDLTMHGVTKPVSWDAEFLGATANPQGGTTVGFTATTKLKRSDYGITWNKTLHAGGVVLGDDVTVVVNLEAHKTEPAGAAAVAKKGLVKDGMKPAGTKKK